MIIGVLIIVGDKILLLHPITLFGINKIESQLTVHTLFENIETKFSKEIGRRKFIEWPALSPDINSLIFFLWDYLKTKMYTIIKRVNSMVSLMLFAMDKKYLLTVLGMLSYK